MRMPFLFLVALGLLSFACGIKRPKPKKDPSADSKSEEGVPSFNIKERWIVETKTCGQITAAHLELESYLVGDSYFVRVQKFSETDEMLCKMGHFFERLISSYEVSKSVYKETAILRPTQVKTTCWKKGNEGLTKEILSNDVANFEGSISTLEMSLFGNRMQIILGGMADCADDKLQLQLIRK